MTRLVSIDELPPAALRGVISLGNFDGVHRGHAALLGEVKRLAQRLDCPSVAVVLDPHPVSLLRPDAAPERLMTIPRRAERLGELGIDYLVVCPIDRDFLRMTADEFFESLIVRRLEARGMVEGPNFFFGRNRGGDVQYLRKVCDESSIELVIVEPSEIDGKMVSSTRIRELIRAGSVAEANSLLGAPYRVEGNVGHGEQRGRQLGFPTANMTDVMTLLPGDGVYGGIARVRAEDTIASGTDAFLAAIHVGSNPTFEKNGSRKVEVHLLDYSGDLYERRLQVDFLEHVRDIARFDSAERLVEQMTLDIQTIRDRLTSQSTPLR